MDVLMFVSAIVVVLVGTLLFFGAVAQLVTWLLFWLIKKDDEKRYGKRR